MDVFSFKSFVEDKAKENILEIEYLRPSAVEKTKGIIDVELAMRIQGYYANFVDYIGSLENVNIQVKRMGVNKIKDDEEKMNWELVLKGYIIKR